MFRQDRQIIINAEPIPYKIGEKVKIVGNPDLETTRECIAVSYSNFVSDLNIGGTILIDDGSQSDSDKTSEQYRKYTKHRRFL